MLEIVTHGPNAHELRRDGVRVAVVDDIADARKLAAVDDLLAACKSPEVIHPEDGVIVRDGPSLLYQAASLIRDLTRYDGTAAMLAAKADGERSAIAKAEGK
jgi:hypothetical protein